MLFLLPFPDPPAEQSNEHGQCTIGTDARVNLGRPVFGMPSSSSSSSSSLESASKSCVTNKAPDVIHQTALSIAERLQQHKDAMDEIKLAETVVVDDVYKAETVIIGSDDDDSHDDSQDSNTKQLCPVMNCEVIVTNHIEMEEHLEEQHSPCNPCKHLITGKLRTTSKEFVCPVCLLKFKVSN